MNYKNLLAKYMKHVENEEGSLFLSYRDKNIFTNEEYEVLCDIAENLDETIEETGYSDYVYTGRSPSSLR